MSKLKVIRVTTVPISLYSLLTGQLGFLNKYYEIIGVSSEGELRKEVESREGIKTIPIEMTRYISPIKDLKSVWQLYKLFKKEKPFIVHTHTPKAGITGMLAAKLANVPHRLHTVGGLPLIIEKGTKYKLLYWVEKITYLCSTKVFPISYGIRDYIVSKKIAGPKKLEIILNGSSNGIDTDFFNNDHFSEIENSTLRTALNIALDDFVFVFVGRLVGDKGINELVKAFSYLKDNKKNSKLILVGPYEAALDPLKKETIDEIKNNKNIISVGFQKDVRPYLAISSALVFPSYREGFGNVVAQAGAMGIPSIVSDITGCNEIIVNGKNGIIVPAQTVDPLLTAMLSFMEDAELVNTLKTNARKMIVDRYEQSAVWEAILDEYNVLHQ